MVLKKFFARFIIEFMQDEIQDFTQIFLKLDNKDNLWLTKEEFQKGIGALCGEQDAKSQVKKVFEMFGLKGKDLLSINDFILFWIRKSLAMDPGKIIQMFA